MIFFITVVLVHYVSASMKVEYEAYLKTHAKDLTRLNEEFRLAAFTAASVSSLYPNEIVAKASSFDGFITTKSFAFEGATHFPFI